MANEFLQDEQVRELADAMLTLSTQEEMLAFFEDIFTIREVQTVAQRLAVARLLRRRVTYQEIAERTGASTATISRVTRFLSYGPGGYQMVFERLEQAQGAGDGQSGKQDGEQNGKHEEAE